MSVVRYLSAETRRRISEANPIVEIVGADVPLRRAGAVFVGLCCFHREKSPSLTVSPARWRFRCYGCGAAGDGFDYIMAKGGGGFADAVRHLTQRAGIVAEELGTSTGIPVDLPSLRKPSVEEPAKVLQMPADLRPLTTTQARAVAERRGLSVAGLNLAVSRGLLWCGSPRHLAAWIVTDRQRVNAQARRLDGRLWQHIGGKKAYTLPGSRAAWPIGVREADSFPCVALVEGGPDLLAACHFVAAEGREKDVTAVSMLGAANDIPEDALLFLANKRVRLFPHLDTAGREAAVRWSRQLERVGCDVDAFDFHGLRRADGGVVADLNDLAAVDADDFEANRADLERILPE